MPISNKQSPLFACAATAFGFKSLFSEIFRPEDCTHAYILKGSCGSGKSSIIKKIAAECEKRNQKYELFACSFDPSSYDGIILGDMQIYIIDGTSPHITDPSYPGAVETVIDTCRGLDSGAMEKHRDLIIRLCRESNSHFSRAYSFLRAAHEVDRGMKEIVKSGFAHGKMQAAIGRFSRDCIPYGSGYIHRKCLTEVYCKDGIYKSGAFFDKAEKRCLVTDKYGTGHIFMEAMLREAAKKCQPVTVSLSPLDFETVNALYLPEVSMAFSLSESCEDREEYFRIFNMARFTDKSVIAHSKKKIRFMKKCFSSLTDGAVESLKNAYECHAELEKLYSLNTDYKENDIITKKLISDIFK